MDSPESVKTHYVRCLKCNKILECSRYDTNALLEHIRNDHKEIEIVDVDDNDNDSSSYKGYRGTTSTGNNGYKNSDENISANRANGYTGTNGYNPANTMQRRRQSSIREAANHIVAPCPNLNTNGPSSKPIDCSITTRNKEHNLFEPSIGSKSEEFEDFKPQSTSSRERIHCGPRRIDEACGVPPERRCNLQSPKPDQPKRSLFRTSIEKWHPADGTIYCPKCGANKRPLIRTHAERSSHTSCCAVCILSCWPFCFLPFLLPSDNKEYLHCSNCKTFLGLYDRAKNCVRPNREYLQPEDMDIKETEADDCKERKKCRCA